MTKGLSLMYAAIYYWHVWSPHYSTYCTPARCRLSRQVIASLLSCWVGCAREPLALRFLQGPWLWLWLVSRGSLALAPWLPPPSSLAGL